MQITTKYHCHFVPHFPSKELLSDFTGEVLIVQGPGEYTEVFDLSTCRGVNPLAEVRRFTEATKTANAYMVGNLGVNGGLFRFVDRSEAFGIIERWLGQGRDCRQNQIEVMA